MTNNKKDMSTLLREWLTIIVLIGSLMGWLYSAYAKPQEHINIIKESIRELQTGMEYISKDVQWIKSRMK